MEELMSSSKDEQDLSQGYQICVEVLPDGFRIGNAEPLEENEETDEGESTGGDLIPDLGTALKHLMAEIKANPVGESEQSGFDSVANMPKK